MRKGSGLEADRCRENSGEKFIAWRRSIFSTFRSGAQHYPTAWNWIASMLQLWRSRNDEIGTTDKRILAKAEIDAEHRIQRLKLSKNNEIETSEITSQKQSYTIKNDNINFQKKDKFYITQKIMELISINQQQIQQNKLYWFNTASTYKYNSC